MIKSDRIFRLMDGSIRPYLGLLRGARFFYIFASKYEFAMPDGGSAGRKLGSSVQVGGYFDGWQLNEHGPRQSTTSDRMVQGL